MRWKRSSLVGTQDILPSLGKKKLREVHGTITIHIFNRIYVLSVCVRMYVYMHARVEGRGESQLLFLSTILIIIFETSFLMGLKLSK